MTQDQRMQQLTMLSSEGWRLHANHKHRVSATMTTAMLADTQTLSDSLSFIPVEGGKRLAEWWGKYSLSTWHL